MRTWRRGVGICLLFGVSACGSEDEPAAAPASSSVEESDGRPEGSLTWRACGGVECAEVEVPIDYAAPEAGSIAIAINRIRASADAVYRGVIVFNPGGPGEPGKQLVANSAAALRIAFPGFDFVGFDPRGIGESAPLGCEVGVDLEAAYADGGFDAAVAALESASQRCALTDGALFQHMGSNQVVADIDRIRMALGHEEINFYGLSYGTRLGALYALQFPEHARAVVLDAPLSPRADIVEQIDVQFDALLQAHEVFFEGCAAGLLDCPLEPQAVFDAVVADAEQNGVRAQFLGVWKFLLATPIGLDQAAALLRDAAAFFARGPSPEQPAPEQLPSEDPMTPMMPLALPEIAVAANLTTNCADNAVPLLGKSEAEALLASFEQRSSLFGRQGAAALTCNGWQVQPDPVALLEFTPRVPPLVIGGVADILTPFFWAEEMAQAIVGSSLLASEHYGHGAISFAGRCYANVVRAYLEDLEPAAPGMTCPVP
jgi:pimeloyl-ACP methyl ester carboxylesterase